MANNSGQWPDNISAVLSSPTTTKKLQNYLVENKLHKMEKQLETLIKCDTFLKNAR
jgi:hypothetical protein